MREYKFRAWDNHRRKMWMHDEIDKSDAEGIYLWGALLLNKEAGFTLMQFTGLKDKNGREIYEGDIVKSHWYRDKEKTDYIGDIWEVKFGEHSTSNDYYASSAYGWYGKSKTEEHTLHNIPVDDNDWLEVIGNIHEHPHLLEKK